MRPIPDHPIVSFAGQTLIAKGRLADVVLATKAHVDARGPDRVLLFDGVTSELVEIDFRGTAGEVLGRLPAEPAAPEPPADADGPRTPGRPRLGVVAREVTLLPRHWEWLGTQPGGASAALRRLVETARKANVEADRQREARDSAYRFVHAMAGDEPGFEEASRALFAGDRELFEEHVAAWPADVRDHALALAALSFPAPPVEAC